MDLVWAGTLYPLSKNFDRVACRKPKTLPIAADVNFYNITTSADETLQALFEDNPSVEVHWKGTNG